MTVLVGNAFYIEFDGVAISGDFRKFDDGVEDDTAEGSAGGDTVRNYVRTILKVEPSGTFIVDTDAYGVAARAVLIVGNEGNLIWGPKGNTAGFPKWGVLANISKANIVATYDEEQELEVEWYVSGKALLFDGRSATF